MVEHSVLFAFRNRKGDLALVPGVRCHCVRTPGSGGFYSTADGLKSIPGMAVMLLQRCLGNKRLPEQAIAPFKVLNVAPFIFIVMLQ